MRLGGEVGGKVERYADAHGQPNRIWLGNLGYSNRRSSTTP